MKYIDKIFLVTLILVTLSLLIFTKMADGDKVFLQGLTTTFSGALLLAMKGNSETSNAISTKSITENGGAPDGATKSAASTVKISETN